MQKLNLANHFMIDLETLGLKPDSVVLSIGCCRLTESEDEMGPRFYQELEVNHQIHTYGRKIESEVQRWWDGIGNCPNQGIALSYDVIKDLNEFLKSNTSGAIYLWSKGTDFDIPILYSLYYTLQIPVPWKYDSVRDLRTLKALTQVDLERRIEEQAHYALGDALYQARTLKAILSGLSFNRYFQGSTASGQ